MQASINKEIERKQLARVTDPNAVGCKFDPAVLTREKTLEIMKYVEDHKLDVLSELSNPFKAVREKEEVVIDL